MPQIKKQASSVGLWPLFQADVLEFTKRWLEKITVHKAALETLALVAVQPGWLLKKPSIVLPEHFAQLYADAPDFTRDARRLLPA